MVVYSALGFSSLWCFELKDGGVVFSRPRQGENVCLSLTPRRYSSPESGNRRANRASAMLGVGRTIVRDRSYIRRTCMLHEDMYVCVC